MRRALTAVLLLLTATALADEKRFSLEDVLSAPFIDQLCSTKGRIAWVANDRGARNVWTAESPKFEPRQLTKFAGDEGIDLGQLTISRDGKWVAFTRGGDLEFGAENPNPASLAVTPEQDVFTVSLADGAVHRIGEGRSPVIAPGGNRVAFIAKKQLMVAPLDGSAKAEALITATGARTSLAWSPDGTKIAFTAQRKEHAFIGVIDIATKTIRYLDPSVDLDVSPAWINATNLVFLRIAAMSDLVSSSPMRTAQPWSIRIADATTGRGRELWHADEGRGSAFRGTESDPALWLAGDRIVFPWEKDGWTHLYSLPMDGGAPRLLTPGDFEVQHVASDGDSILYSSNEGDIDRRHVWRVPADGSAKPAAVTSGKTIEWSPVRVDAKTVAFIRSDARHPSRVFVNERAITPLPATFPANALVEPQQVIFPSSDGLPIHGQLFLPHDSVARHPAAVFFHGGSQRQMLLGWHYMDYYANAYGMNQYLASRGYVVLSVNYRSGIGYGLDFREALHYGAAGVSEVNDVTGAALYLRTRGDVDPKRIVAWGGSYGGFLTAFALAKASDLYAAGVDLHGVHDWNQEIKVWVPSYDPANNQALAQLAKASSPITYVDTWRAPVLLIQGDDDRNVPFTETIHLAEALRKRHVHVETLVFPDEIHDFLMHRSWLAAYHAADDFFARMLTNPASSQ